MSFFKYVLSPEGEVTDCYRTWESMVLGSIPIITKNDLGPLFDGLPVIWVDNWKEEIDFNQAPKPNPNHPKLFLRYWWGLVIEKKKEIDKEN